MTSISMTVLSDPIDPVPRKSMERVYGIVLPVAILQITWYLR